MNNKGFTLVEVLIVVGILGILSAIIYPEYQNHVQEAKESAAMDNLRILRSAINLYAAQHGDVPPGYPNGDMSQTASMPLVLAQLTQRTNKFHTVGTAEADYPYGPYMKSLPENPFNNKKSIQVINDLNQELSPNDATAWIYKPKTREIITNTTGTDSKNREYKTY